MLIRMIAAVCMPVSRRRSGSVGNPPAGLGGVAGPAAGLSGSPLCAGAPVWLVAGPMYAMPTVSQTIRNVALTAVESVYMTSSCLRARPNARPVRMLWRVLDPQPRGRAMGRMVEQDHVYRYYRLLYGSRRVSVNKVLTLVLGLLRMSATTIVEAYVLTA